MHETPDDLVTLQALLDRSYERAGTHFREVTTEARRLDAAQVAERLVGMCLLVVSTVTADGRPIGGPLDGIFFRGSFHFGTSPESIRLRHLQKRPWVSATHLPSEELSVTVHGRAVPVDVKDPAARAFRQTLLDIYVPRYGAEWEQFLDSGPVFTRIDAQRMFTFFMPEGSS
jgi:nitroimidazol reductase NimA-like FMN-containing flavoprotein (pyridoxamine 5'-phosphate oxidase superfamily)